MPPGQNASQKKCLLEKMPPGYFLTRKKKAPEKKKLFQLVNMLHIVVGREKLLIGSAVSRTHSLLITHRNKHKSSSLTS